MRIRALAVSTFVAAAMLAGTAAPASAREGVNGTFSCPRGVTTLIKSSYNAHHAVNSTLVTYRFPGYVLYTSRDWPSTSGYWGVGTDGWFYYGGARCR